MALLSPCAGRSGFGVRSGIWGKNKIRSCLPLYYPQAKTNPQESFAYPNAALAEFWSWLQGEYIQKKFTKYLLQKIKKGDLSLRVGQNVLLAFNIDKYKLNA
ncbi:MAG: hypothetical protein K5657_04440 [Desulfovibrio sp.]|nr:hypothetical protein [Desulfovibrio sp.]